ncbi:thioredoxin family protein [Planococcus versutus]|uniref:Thioredoxin n=1 Tax=Planococcus versutus TaxID=1302659 RepID=A0A1B1RYJ6_9BACL|nr:thioredoxin family protein [Planococcus versutus]ANU25996.1 thioredoxin [Planococcus versutus]
MKKLFIIAGIVVVVFIGIIFLTNQANDEKLANNPYDTEELNQATIDQLDDEDYQNIILPADLEKEIASGEPTTVYFYSPLCSYCQQTTPVLMPVAEEMDVDVLQYNLLEYEEEAAPYQIEATPTLIHYKDGKEVSRWVGAQPKENIELFFTDVVKK